MGGLGLTNYNPSMLFDSSFEFLICLCFHPNKTEFIYNSLVYASVHSSVFRSMRLSCWVHKHSRSIHICQTKSSVSKYLGARSLLKARNKERGGACGVKH